MIANDIGNSAGNALEAGINGDLSGALNQATGATQYIPGVGQEIGIGLNVAGAVSNGNVGGAIGQIVPGQTGGVANGNNWVGSVNPGFTTVPNWQSPA